MGRFAKVPLKGGRLVRVNKVGTGNDTPYHPQDIDWRVMDRLGFGDELPSFADDWGGSG